MSLMTSLWYFFLLTLDNLPYFFIVFLVVFEHALLKDEKRVLKMFLFTDELNHFSLVLRFI